MQQIQKSIHWLVFLIVMLFGLIYSTHGQTLVHQHVEQEDKIDYVGKRKLSIKQRITAEGRYSKLISQFKATKRDIKEMVNQLIYIDNGYLDYGFLNADKHAKYGTFPDAYWVFVYPKWYVWKKQSLDFLEDDDLRDLFEKSK